jgi:uncharacterized protein DUF3943
MGMRVEDRAWQAVRVASLGAVMVLYAAGAGADEAPGTAVEKEARWHLHSSLGFGTAGGGYGDFLEKPVQFELGIAKSSKGGAWRFGGGLQFGSLNLKPSVIPPTVSPDQEETAHFETFVSVTRVFNPRAKFRPYLQGRVGIVRIHPRSELFDMDPLPEDFAVGDSPTRSANGLALTLQPGFEWYLGKTLSLDVGLFGNWYKTGEYDLSPIGLPPVSSGQEYGLRVGLGWQPFATSPPPTPKPAPAVDPATGKLRPLPPADAEYDGWGVRRSWGWSTAEMLGINFGSSMVNEYVRYANFNQISPRSFWANFDHGFTYDDNKFRTNQLVHPMNGAMYFNSARANGIGFWGSSLMSIAGAFVWECCGETHPMSFNDMVSTGIGGMARGEVMYRLSSLILDNTSRGKGRVGREAAAFLASPVRGFNRILSGDAGEVQGNPVDPYDWRPDFQLALRAGGRVIGQGESITENTNKYGFFEWTLSYGNPWDSERHRPFDRFDLVAQSNFGDKTRLGRLLIRGDLFTRRIGDGKRHLLTLQQDFDYIDNEAYEYGGQAFGPGLLSRYDLSPKYTLYSRLQAFFILLGATKADYSFLADVAERERLREYDYGPGAGTSIELYLQRNRLAFLTGRYRYSYIDVSNGSTYSGPNLGLGSSHNVHQAQLKLEFPVYRSLAVGADSSLFFRRSHYDVSLSQIHSIAPGRYTITKRNPEVRLFLSWTYNH